MSQVEVLRKALITLEYNMRTICNQNPCAPEWKALDRLARLVEADYEVNQAKRRYSEVQGQPEAVVKGALVNIWACEAAATDALSAVLGEE